MKKNIILALIVAAMIICTASCGKSDENVGQLPSESITDSENGSQDIAASSEISEIKIEKGAFSEQKSFSAGNTSTINASYPIVTADEYGENAMMLNSIFESNVDDLKNRYIAFNSQAESGATTVNGAFAMEHTVYSAGGGIVSVMLKTGINDGTVITTEYRAVNFDLRNSNQILLTGIEGITDDSLSAIKDLILAEMQKSPDVYGNTLQSGVMDTLDLNNSFVLEGGNVIFFFDPAVIGANSTELLTMEFTTEQLVG